MEVLLGELKFKGFEGFHDLEKDLEYTLDQAFDRLLPNEYAAMAAATEEGQWIG